MRLTGGRCGGRVIQAPLAGLRPTQDKVRAAIYSSIAPQVPGARVLDLFAGTGALGLEAWSRGAAWVQWVEGERKTLRVLRDNLEALGVSPDEGRVVATDVFRLLAMPCAGPAFDLVLADPPYAEARQNGWWGVLAGLLARQGWLAPGGLFVFETEGKEPIPGLTGWRLVRDKTYGSTRVLIAVLENETG